MASANLSRVVPLFCCGRSRSTSASSCVPHGLLLLAARCPLPATAPSGTVTKNFVSRSPNREGIRTDYLCIMITIKRALGGRRRGGRRACNVRHRSTSRGGPHLITFNCHRKHPPFCLKKTRVQFSFLLRIGQQKRQRFKL